MEKLDLIKILKDAPEGTPLYSPLFGDITLAKISDVKNDKSIKVITDTGVYYYFRSNGQYYPYPNSECLLFPSKDNRDWNKFNNNKEKFNFNTLNHFDKVIVRDEHSVWRVNFFSHINKNAIYAYVCSGGAWAQCMPYNDETKHWVGTYDEIPSKYKEE